MLRGKSVASVGDAHGTTPDSLNYVFTDEAAQHAISQGAPRFGGHLEQRFQAASVLRQRVAMRLAQPHLAVVELGYAVTVLAY